MVPVALETFSVRDLRNLERVDCAFGPGLNVLAGANAQGKTNLLDAIYALCCTKSFRGARPGEMVAWGAETASVRGRVREGSSARTLSVGFRKGGSSAAVDGAAPSSRRAYATSTPVVAFHPGAMSLSQGAAAERRRLLDRVGMFLSEDSLDACSRYTSALRSRQRTLETRGPNAAELGEWEALVARYGCSVAETRTRAVDLLQQVAGPMFSRMFPRVGSLSCVYGRTAPEDEATFVADLARRRAQDIHRGSSGIGPHRDDLVLRIDGREVRGSASQGQHRSIVLALTLAEMAAIREARQAMPILLLDDVSSELDQEKTAALLAVLSDGVGQVFVTTTRPELLSSGWTVKGTPRVDWVVVAGQVLAPSPAS